MNDNNSLAHTNLKYKYGNRSFWCRGYYVDTAGKNTKKIAEALAKATEGDIERIETVRKYGPYAETIEVGQAEVQRGGVSAAAADEEGYRGI